MSNDAMKKLWILSGGAAQGLVESLRPAFEAETGCAIEGTFGAVGAMRRHVHAHISHRQDGSLAQGWDRGAHAGARRQGGARQARARCGK